MNAACEEALNEPEPEPDPSREGIDWIRTESGDLAHPLQNTAFEAAVKFQKAIQALRPSADTPAEVGNFVFELHMTAAKLAGALGAVARGVALPEPAFTVACLKRALDHLHKSQAGLEAATEAKLLPEDLASEARKQLFDLREGIVDLMRQYRNEGWP